MSMSSEIGSRHTWMQDDEDQPNSPPLKQIPTPPGSGQKREQGYVQERHPVEPLIIQRAASQETMVTLDTRSAPTSTVHGDDEHTSEIRPPTKESTSEGETILARQIGIRDIITDELRAGRYELPAMTEHHSIETSDQPPGKCNFPPALPSFRQSRHRERFDRAAALPDRNLPFDAQIMEHVKDWADLGSRIQDEARRKEVLDRVFETLKSAWFEALRLGYDPGDRSVDPQTPLQHVGKDPALQSAARAPPGRPNTELQPSSASKPRQKRAVDPSKVAVLTSKSHRDGNYWVITRGELENAGLSEERIRTRASSGNLGRGEELLKEVIAKLGRQPVAADWSGQIDNDNPYAWRRDLLIYSLYEVGMSRKSLATLRQIYDSFTQRARKANTQKRIDDEQERHDLFMALALEMDEMTSPSRVQDDHEGGINGDRPTAPEGILATKAHTNKVSHVDVVSVLPPPRTESSRRMDKVATEVPSASHAPTAIVVKRSLSSELKEKKSAGIPPTKKLKTDNPEEMVVDPGIACADSHSPDGQQSPATLILKEAPLKGPLPRQLRAENSDSNKEYIERHNLPKVNQSLVKAGMGPTKTTGSPYIRQALRNAGASVHELNSMHTGLHEGLMTERKVDNPVVSSSTVAGETASTSEPVGRSPPEHHSLIVTLQLSAAFDPDEFSSDKVSPTVVSNTDICVHRAWHKDGRCADLWMHTSVPPSHCDPNRQ